MNKKIVVTDSGLKKLEDELENLKIVRRKEISDKIRVALSFGDLSENSEYDEAKNEQAIVEARIAELEVMLKNVHILDEDELATDIISVGSKAKIFDTDFNEETLYHIVGSTEADPSQNKISDESPIGRALLGKRVGDVVTITIPSGDELKFEILEIGR